MANLNASPTTEPAPSPSPLALPQHLFAASLFSHAFPFTPLGAPTAIRDLIDSHLPPWPTATHLVQTYLAQVLWIFHGVTRAQLVDDMLPAIYHTQSAGAGGDEPVAAGEDYSGPHDLALLFIVFAIGALVQPTADADADAPSDGSAQTTTKSTSATASSALGEHFHQLARAALALQPVLEKPAIVTIQALHLMSIYNAMSGTDLRNETSMEMTWGLLTLAAHLAQTVRRFASRCAWPPDTLLIVDRPS